MSKATLYISGVIGTDVKLVDVTCQLKAFEDVSEVHVIIDSVGGDVDTGESIYNYLKGLDKDTPVTTEARKAYSIAAHIFSAGSTRIVEDKDDVFMIHCPWATVSGNADELEWYADILREEEAKFASFYSSLTGEDSDTIALLLCEETYMSGEQAVSMGFATETKEVALKAVAMVGKRNDLPKTKQKMTKKKDHKSLLVKAVQAIEALGGLFRAEVTLQDTSGDEIVFPDVEEGATPVVGDAATIDGSPVPDGERVIPGMNDVTVTFEGGVITSIVEKEDEGSEGEGGGGEEGAQASEEAKPQAKAKSLIRALVKAEEIQQISTWTMNVENSSFSEGDKITYMDEWDDTSRSVGAGEFQLQDGRRVVTDASGVIVSIKEASGANEPTVDMEAMEQIKVMREEIKAMKLSQAKELEKRDNEISTLKAQLGSPAIGSEPKVNAKKEESEELTGAARYYAALRKSK